MDLKQLPPKPKSMQADGQRKELQRITADNKRLYAQPLTLQPRSCCNLCRLVRYRSLQEIKPTVPSLKQIEHRSKDLER